MSKKETPAPLAGRNRVKETNLVRCENRNKGNILPQSKQATPRRLTVKARAIGLSYFTVRGQTARTLLALVDAGPKGNTALEVSSWALRFAAYCHDLKHKHGLTIRTDREEHPGGWHGRHVLETPVEIIEISCGNEVA